MWNKAEQALPKILSYTKPDAILILGIDMAKKLPEIPESIRYHSVKQPSQFFKYSDWQPGLQSFLSSVRGESSADNHTPDNI